MQRRDQFLEGLLELHRMRDPGAQRSAWRSSLARLSQACAEDQPSPLEGLSPGQIVESVRVALGLGLLDDLGWLSSASAAAALYEIAAALPPGGEKRELGRRVLGRQLEGDAATFVALATRMALGGGKGLGGEAVRARVALAVALPARSGVRVEALAFALVSRRDLARSWVGAGADGSLADRRLAGRLLEQAARAAARRAAEGDERGLTAFRGEAVAQGWRRLLDDREPAVWRHVAVARGLLAPYAPQHLDAIEQGLRPELSPTEWRRAATSAVALGAVRPELSRRLVREAVTRGLLRRDPGAVAALLWGLPAAAEVEPEQAETLLDDLFTEAEPLAMAEALAEVLPQGPGGAFGERAVRGLRELLGRAAPSSLRGDDVDDGAVALRARVVAELRPLDERELTPRELVAAGLDAFAERGARAAFGAGQEALDAVEGGLATLEALDDESSLARRTGFAALRSIDAAVLEDGLLRDLLLLGGRGAETQATLERHEAALERMSRWLGEREQVLSGRSTSVPHRTMRLARLRAILRLADARGEGGAEGAMAQATLARRFRLAALMLRHLVSRPPPVLHRTVAAAFARAVDALLRDDAIDLADVLLVVAQRGLSADDLRMLLEASMNSDLRSALKSFLSLLAALEASEPGAASSEYSPSSTGMSGEYVLALTSYPPAAVTATPLTSTAASRKVDALMAMARGLEVDASARTEALRGSLFRLGRALGRLLAATSLSAVAGVGSAETSPVRELEAALTSLAQLCAGARQRLDDRSPNSLQTMPSLTLATALDEVLRGSDTDSLVFAVASAREELSLGLPPVFVEIVASTLETLMTLPLVASAVQAPQAAAPAEAALPAWLPRRRTLGGFYIVRPLGSGAGGTVFVVRRIEDRHNEAAERFALKVPDYDGNAARTLSEEEFMQLFREEATALLGLPAHPNLARFVTFDLASRPKPILVMELVEGQSLERLLQNGKVSVVRIFDVLDGVLAGLEAMHGAGIGHLDVKPSNVILRAGRVPVLVDFGLSGRNIRPGCATLPYGAPEIWGVTPPNWSPAPPPVDVYAFACMAFELLTTHDLYDGPNEMAIIAAHLRNDGWPEPLSRLGRDAAMRPLAEALSRGLRRHPGERARAGELRRLLRDAASKIHDRPWPLRVS